MDWTLEQIRAEVRRLTGRRSTNSLSNADIDARINNYYQFLLPYELDVHELDIYGQFVTTAGVGEYTKSSESGDGVLITFGTAYPTFGSELLTMGSLSTQDILRIEPGVKAEDSSGDETDVSLYLDPISFRLDYPDASHDETSERNVPSGLLLHQNIIYLRPVPDAAYTIKFPAKIDRPPALTAVTDIPLDRTWGWLICHGAAIQIHKAAGEHDEAEAIGAMYEQLKSVISRKQILRYPATHRAAPRF